MVIRTKLYLPWFRFWFLDPIFAPRPRMGSIARMGPKPPVSCAYVPRPSPPTHISKSIFQKYTLPYPPKFNSYHTADSKRPKPAERYGMNYNRPRLDSQGNRKYDTSLAELSGQDEKKELDVPEPAKPVKEQDLASVR